jgi:MFS transporter, ACS family, hexuronate transporter
VHFIANSAGIIAPWVTGALVNHNNSWAGAFGLAALIAVTTGLLAMGFARKPAAAK